MCFKREGSKLIHCRLPLPYGEMLPSSLGAAWPLSPMPTLPFKVHYSPFCGLLASRVATWAPV